MSHVLCLLLCLASAEPNKITIVYDGTQVNNKWYSHESQLLYCDITRDYKGKEQFSFADNIQQKIKPNIILINKNDIKLMNEHRVPYLPFYPMYRVGNYKDFRRFDERTFMESTFPLLTINALYISENFDERAWKEVRDTIRVAAFSEYTNKVIVWVFMNGYKDLENFNEYCEQDYQIELVAKKYGKEKGFPVWKEPEGLEDPRVPFPWEIGGHPLIKQK